MKDIVENHISLYREKLGLHEDTELKISKSLTESYRVRLLYRNNILSLDYNSEDFIKEFNPDSYCEIYTTTDITFSCIETTKKFISRFKSKIKSISVPIFPGIINEYQNTKIKYNVSDKLFHGKYVYSLSMDKDLLRKHGKLNGFNDFFDTTQVSMRNGQFQNRGSQTYYSTVMNFNNPDILTELLLYYPEYILAIRQRLLYEDIITNSKIRL